MLAQTRPSHRPWSLVFRYELFLLWGVSKGLLVLLAYSILLSGLAYAVASDAELNLLDARESVGVIVAIAMALGALAALVAGADAISGERERGTLESILVTPVPRYDLVVGKLLAANSMWIATLVVAVPYIVVLSEGPGVTGDALGVLLGVGSLVSIALAALGVAVSSIATSNRTSLVASVALLLVLAAPSQLPAITADSVVGSVLILANPVSAGLKAVNEILIGQQSWASQWSLLVAPAVAAVVLTIVAVARARRLEIGTSR